MILSANLDRSPMKNPIEELLDMSINKFGRYCNICGRPWKYKIEEREYSRYFVSYCDCQPIIISIYPGCED